MQPPQARSPTEIRPTPAVFPKRPMRRSWAVLSLLVLFSRPLLAAPPTPAKPVLNPKPGLLKGWNVVLITLDATDPARIGTYGGSPKVMPFLDSLAKTGTVIERAYALTPETAPSHATMFSASHPATHG